MHTPKTLNPVARIAATLAFTIVALAMLAGVAAADMLPLQPDLELQLPGPDPDPEPTPPWVIADVEILPLPLRPTAQAEVSCESGTVEIEIGNKTPNHWFIEVWADGAVIGGGPIAPNNAMVEQVALAENESTHVIVSVLTETTLIDETFTMDCLTPLPDYDVFASCGSGQAWARLINHGDDTAYMGVQYPDVMHMEIEVAPHSSEDWLLAVSPGQSVEFEVMASNVSIGDRDPPLRL